MVDIVPPLEPELADLMLRLVRIDGGRHETFVPVFGGGMAPMEFAGHDLDESEPEIKPQLVHELAAYDLVAVEPAPGKILGPFRITPLGRQTAQAAITSATANVHQRLSRGEGLAVDTSWPALEPILREIHSRYLASGAANGIPGRDAHRAAAPELSEAQFATSLRVLRDGGFVDYSRGVGSTVPNGIRPTQRTIERYGGWPSNTDDQIVQRLFDALDDAIDKTDDPDQKSKIRNAKKAVGEISKSVAASAIFHAGKAAAGGL